MEKDRWLVYILTDTLAVPHEVLKYYGYKDQNKILLKTLCHKTLEFYNKVKDTIFFDQMKRPVVVNTREIATIINEAKALAIERMTTIQEELNKVDRTNPILAYYEKWVWLADVTIDYHDISSDEYINDSLVNFYDFDLSDMMKVVRRYQSISLIKRSSVFFRKLVTNSEQFLSELVISHPHIKFKLRLTDIEVVIHFDFYLYGRSLQDIINPPLVEFSCLKINWSALENSIKDLLGVEKLWINLNFDADRAFIFEDRKYNSLF